MRERLITAAVALLLGVAFCFAMYAWQTPYKYPSPNEANAPLFASIPFAGLAVLIVFGLRRSASVLGWIVLATLIGLAFAPGAHSWGGTTPNDAMFYRLLYGAIVLGHLLAGKHPPRPEEAKAAIPLGIVLLASTVIAAFVCTRFTGTQWGTTAIVAPLWLSAAFALGKLAVGRTRVWFACLSFAAAFLALVFLDLVSFYGMFAGAT